MVNLKQPAEKWVSAFVLLGCVVITAFLVFAAYKANDLGSHLSSQSSEAIGSDSF